MKTEEIKLSNGKVATGYVAELGPVNIVFANTDNGLIGCGAIDAGVFDKYDYPAAKIRGLDGRITSVEDLLAGTVIGVNKVAGVLGIAEGLTGKEALEKM